MADRSIVVVRPRRNHDQRRVSCADTSASAEQQSFNVLYETGDHCNSRSSSAFLAPATNIQSPAFCIHRKLAFVKMTRTHPVTCTHARFNAGHSTSKWAYRVTDLLVWTTLGAFAYTRTMHVRKNNVSYYAHFIGLYRCLALRVYRVGQKSEATDSWP